MWLIKAARLCIAQVRRLRLSLFEKVILANSLMLIGEALAGLWVTSHNIEAHHYLIDTGFIVLATLLGLLVNYLLLRASFRPLFSLLHTMRAVSAGAIHKRAPGKSSDTEIAELARAFNSMLDRLEAARREQAIVLRTCKGQYEGRHPRPQTPAGLTYHTCGVSSAKVGLSLPALEALGGGPDSGTCSCVAQQDALGGGNLSGLYTGQVDGPTLFNLIAITLVELGAVFWVGAQLWLVFVLQPVSDDHKEQSNTNRQVQLRFERLFSFPTLLMLLLANIGVLLGQALNFTGGQWGPAFAPTLLSNLATSGRFGTFWMMREIVIGAALLLSLYILFFKRRPKVINGIPHEVSIRAPLRSAEGIPAPQAGCYILPWANLILGLALFIAITMSSHAAAVSKSVVFYAVPIDWLHLLAAAFWVGGMMYIATTYLPVIHRAPIAEQARSLITTLPYYTPWAIAGVVIMVVTGPFSATFHLTSWAQFIKGVAHDKSGLYGRALVVKILLVGALLTTSAIHVCVLRPRLKKEYWKYAYIAGRVADDQAITESDRPTKLLAQQAKLREGRLSKKTRRLTEVLRWEPLLGVAVLVCVGLMNVFAGTLSPTSAQQQQPTGNVVGPRFIAGSSFNTTVKTTDSEFTIILNVNPNRFGTNIFTVSVVDNSIGKPTTNVGVSLYTTMLDMDMGTDTVNLLPDGKGHFSASGDLSMGGNYQIRIQIRTPNNTLHEARVQFYVPF